MVMRRYRNSNQKVLLRGTSCPGWLSESDRLSCKSGLNTTVHDAMPSLPGSKFHNFCAVPPNTASRTSFGCLLRYSIITFIVCEYEAATVQTGQSEPIIKRSGPKQSSATTNYGEISSRRQHFQAA